MWDLGFVCLCAKQRQRGKCILVLHLCISRREKWKAFTQTDPLLCLWRLAMAAPATRFMSGTMRTVTPQPAAAVQGSLGLHFLFWWWARLLYGRVSAQSFMPHAHTHMCSWSAHVNTYLYRHMYICAHIHIQYMHACMLIHACMWMNTFLHTHIHTFISLNIHAHTYTHVICICMPYMHTCIHIFSLLHPPSLSTRFSQAGGFSLDNGWPLLPGPVIAANSVAAQVILTKMIFNWISN